ncbi:MAG: DUF1761 domain-containing protein [Candidatus Zixiibacteriota bacterium]
MESPGINFLAVLVAAAAYFILGAIWYSPALFGNHWTKLIGKTKEQVRADFSPWKLVGAFIGGFFSAYGIARILSWTSLEPMWGGFGLGLMAGICFAAATVAVNDVMESRSMKLTIINSLYNVIGFVGMGLIIGAWR